MKNIINKRLFISLGAGLALALLSGCGSSSSGSSGSGGRGYEADFNSDTIGGIGSTDSIGSGSVIQSAANAEGPNKDTVSLSFERDEDESGNLGFRLDYSSPQGGFRFTVDHTADEFTYEGTERAAGDEELEFRHYEYEDEGENGEYTFIDLYTNADADAATVNINWLAGGVWVHLPEGQNVTTDYELGAFVANGYEDIPSDSIDDLTGTATYTGGAYGWFYEWIEGVGYAGEFDGNVSLVASFGADDVPGSISGVISDIEYYEEFGDEVIGVDEQVVLHSTSIGGVDNGFFRGATSITTETGDDDVARTFTGAWGGEFINARENDNPEYVGGTFGGECLAAVANNGCDEDYEAGYIGIFIARDE